MAKILVVDKFEDDRKHLKEELEGEGHDVITAGDGYNALNVFRDKEIDLIILELKIPEIDGLELINTFRHEDKDVPIIIYTAFSLYKNHFGTWGADVYLMKSVGTRKLKDGIEYLLAD